jgi:hypothetical protein
MSDLHTPSSIYYPDDPTPPGGYTEEDTLVTSKGADPTHHIKLVDGEETSVGFVIANQEGDLDERTFRRFPSADPQNPYVTEKQESFGGGFGQRVFEENRSKYWRSKGVDTTKDAIALAPMFHYARGAHSKARDYMPKVTHTARWLSIRGSYQWLAQPFYPDQEWTKTEYVKFFVRVLGHPAALRVRTYTDVAGEPGVQIHSVDITPDEILESGTGELADYEGGWVRIAFSDTYTYGAGTKYWLVITTAGTDTSGFWRLLGHAGNNAVKSPDGSTWTAGPEFYYRIEGDRQEATHNFFEYKRQLYFITKYDAWAASRLFMNGWRGAADDNSGNKAHLKDSTTDWSTTDWITGDEVIQMYAGPASGEQEDYRQVSSGANGYLVVGRNWQITHGTKDEYVVTNSDWFFEISSSPNLNGRVSDVATGNGLLYICKGNNRYMKAFEEYRNSSGNWTNRWIDCETKAQFIKEVNDSTLGDVLWLGHNRVVDGNYKPYVWYSVPIDGYAETAFDLAHLSPNSGGGAQWVAAGGAQVTVDDVKGGSVKISVEVGEVTGASVNAQGTGYSVDDTLTVNNPDGTDVMTLNVDTVGGGGEVTAVSITDGGYDFDTATGQATTVAPAGGSGCTIDIDTVSTFSGDIAYLDFKDSGGTAKTVDLRNMTTIYTGLSFNHKHDAANELAAGDLKLKLSDQVALGNVISTVNMVGLSAGYPYTIGNATASLALTTTAGSNVVASLGLNLDSGHSLTRSFYLKLSGEWIATRSRSTVEVGFADGDNITGLQAYGDPEQAWVFTESGFGSIKNNKFLPVPMRELEVARHSNNGIGNEVSDVYLLFTWKGRLQRYYRQNMEDLGPDFPEGMSDIVGDIVDVVTYPGRFYVAIDGGNSASSSILVYKGGGWHEVYTSFSGERIRKLHIQPIEGKPDKLWASVGGDVMWFPIILDPTELPANSGYMYAPMGRLDTSWIYASDRDLNKVFRAIWVTLDEATQDPYYLHVYYKVDNEDDNWKKISGKRIHSYSTREFPLLRKNSPAPRGNRIKFRIHIQTRTPSSTPVVRSTQTRIYRVPEIKYIFTWLSKVSSISVNLRGDEERVLGTQATAEAAIGKLDEWASNLTILVTESDIAQVDKRTVVIEPVPFQLLMMVHDEGFQEESIQMACNEV